MDCQTCTWAINGVCTRNVGCHYSPIRRCLHCGKALTDPRTRSYHAECRAAGRKEYLALWRQTRTPEEREHMRAYKRMWTRRARKDQGGQHGK